MGLGESPMDAASRRPGKWTLVYELRPLELIPYWLGIPFRPYHPVYAVIYDAADPAYYTVPASKVAELGRPCLVYGVSPVTRLLDVLAVVDRRLHVFTDVIVSWTGAGLRVVAVVAGAFVAAFAVRSGERL